MFNDAMRVLHDYGWAALFLFVCGIALLRYVSNRMKVWSDRDIARIQIAKDELLANQLFANIEFKLSNEIPSMSFNGNLKPIRQKMFRKLLEIKVVCLKEIALSLINENIEDMTPAQWMALVHEKLSTGDRTLHDRAISAGVPELVINKFMMFRQPTQILLYNYVKDLTVSTFYESNVVRTNTLLYLLNLKLVTVIGDSERNLIRINGEITGLMFEGNPLE
jgi:hypothetical protein